MREATARRLIVPNCANNGVISVTFFFLTALKVQFFSLKLLFKALMPSQDTLCQIKLKTSGSRQECQKCPTGNTIGEDSCLSETSVTIQIKVSKNIYIRLTETKGILHSDIFTMYHEIMLCVSSDIMFMFLHLYY